MHNYFGLRFAMRFPAGGGKEKLIALQIVLLLSGNRCDPPSPGGGGGPGTHATHSLNKPEVINFEF
jgi:hypothetical protein